MFNFGIIKDPKLRELLKGFALLTAKAAQKSEDSRVKEAGKTAEKIIVSLTKEEVVSE